MVKHYMEHTPVIVVHITRPTLLHSVYTADEELQSRLVRFLYKLGKKKKKGQKFNIDYIVNEHYFTSKDSCVLNTHQLVD